MLDETKSETIQSSQSVEKAVEKTTQERRRDIIRAGARFAASNQGDSKVLLTQTINELHVEIGAIINRRR